MHVCDFGDFVDGQCSETTTSPSLETTTTVEREDHGEPSLLFCKQTLLQNVTADQNPPRIATFRQLEPTINLSLSRVLVASRRRGWKLRPRRLPNGRGLRTNRKLCCRTPGRLPESACYFFEGMTRSSRMLHSSAESWSVVHVRWEVAEENFYQRLFSGTPCK